jgi:putative nucleotidyltransferase with HDIG domain
MKKIQVNDVRLGMFIQEMCGSWMDHPFWKSAFKLDSREDLAALQSSSIREVWIDTTKGLDVAPSTPSTSAEVVRTQVESVLATAKPAGEARRSFQEEIEQARRIHSRAKEAVTSMFQEVRMGRALQAEAAVELVEEIHQSIARNSGALLSLARLKNKDNYTYLHSVAVCALMIALGKQLGMEGEALRHLGMAGLLHDVGKMLIPDAILNKPGRLTDAEFDTVKSHPQLGFDVLEGTQRLDEAVLEVCLHHHERMDGKGYPGKHVGDDLTLYARMGAVCDVYDAITSERCYKKGWEPAMAIRKMAEWQEGHFDLRVFHAFVKTVGIYPVGSLVKLKSGRLGVVMDQNANSLITPIIKVFFSERFNAHIPPVLVDLSNTDDAIASPEDPQRWGFKLSP